MRVAVIGAGGAGLTSAWLLDGVHEVTLYEKENRLGGHADTITVDIAGQQVGLDAGFEFFSDIMFPTYVRLLKVLNVPLAPFPMLVTLFDTRTGNEYLMPPFHGWHLFPEGFAPRKIIDLLRFAAVLRASRPIMDRHDTTVTVEQYFDSVRLPQDFRTRFMYPFLQASWGVSQADIRSFAAYNALRYVYLNMPATLIPRGWKEIEGGTQTYVKAITGQYKNVTIKLGAGVTSIQRNANGYTVSDSSGQSAVYDHIVMATNANQAAAALSGVPGTDDMRRLMNQVSYFETTIALHSDTRLMPPQRSHWSTANIRFDGTYSQFSIWKPWKSDTPAFKSWVTHDSGLPDKLYATAKYLHPRINLDYFKAQAALQPFQGKDNIWLAGMYMHDVDCHESAVMSAVNVVRRLAPQSARLKLLTEPAFNV